MSIIDYGAPLAGGIYNRMMMKKKKKIGSRQSHWSSSSSSLYHPTSSSVVGFVFVSIILLFFLSSHPLACASASPSTLSPSSYLTSRWHCRRRCGNTPRAFTLGDAISFPRGGGGKKAKKAEVAVEVVSSLEPKDSAKKSGGGGGGGAVGGGTSSVSQSVANLVKSIVGAGVLSLPAGIAAFADAPSALVPAFALIASMGLVSAYTFSLLGRVCAATGAQSYGDAWDRTVGTSTSWIPASSCALDCYGGVVAYSMILADTFKDLLRTAGLSGAVATRTNALLGVTALILLPLCLMKNLSSLAPFSLLGTIGMAYTALAMAVRYFTGAYSLPDGKLLSGVRESFFPSFGDKGMSAVLNPKSFILVSMLSTSYLAHFVAPQFYNDLENNTVERFNQVVSSSFGAAIAIFAAISALGFLTFGSNCDGLILNNYSTKDGLMSLSRLAVAASIVFSYPFCFVGSRDEILNLVNVPKAKRTDSFINVFSVSLLITVTILAALVKDLGLVLSLSGATFGTALIYIFPPFMFRSLIQKKNKDGTSTKEERSEVTFAMLCAALGAGLCVLGTKMALGGAGAH